MEALWSVCSAMLLFQAAAEQGISRFMIEAFATLRRPDQPRPGFEVHTSPEPDARKGFEVHTSPKPGATQGSDGSLPLPSLRTKARSCNVVPGCR